jgi:hypothetical protein
MSFIRFPSPDDSPEYQTPSPLALQLLTKSTGPLRDKHGFFPDFYAPAVHRGATFTAGAIATRPLWH